MYTVEGCEYVEPETPIKSSSSDVTPTQTSSPTSMPVRTSTSNPDGVASEESHAGMIIGIVFGVLAAIAIVAIIIYFVITNANRINPAGYEEEVEFTSMSL